MKAQNVTDWQSMPVIERRTHSLLNAQRRMCSEEHRITISNGTFRMATCLQLSTIETQDETIAPIFSVFTLLNSTAHRHSNDSCATVKNHSSTNGFVLFN